MPPLRTFLDGVMSPPGSVGAAGSAAPVLLPTVSAIAEGWPDAAGDGPDNPSSPDASATLPLLWAAWLRLPAAAAPLTASFAAGCTNPWNVAALVTGISTSGGDRLLVRCARQAAMQVCLSVCRALLLGSSLYESQQQLAWASQKHLISIVISLVAQADDAHMS